MPSSVDVSVLTPVYADTPEKVTWLSRAISSVRMQQGIEWEMIIVDDFSPFSLDPVKEAFAGDDRLRWVRATANRGPAMARNTAAALARGDALLPLDSDDELASPDILSTMYSVWSEDKTRVVYGNMRREPGGRVIDFAEYDFAKSLDPRGLFPVTGMHSKECHIRAGGWKAKFEHGLEDVEYWICAGAAGFCGRKLPLLTLIYHSNPDNRSRRMIDGKQRTAMEEMIAEVHKDLYQGRYPMSCCGGNKSASTTYSPPPSAPMVRRGLPSLDMVMSGDPDAVYVRYNGAKKGGFGVVGQVTKVTYKVDGPGAEFAIYTADANIFRRAGRGQDFSVGIAPPPPEDVEEVVEEVVEQKVFEAPAPELTEIEHLDSVAARTTEAAPPPLAETATITLVAEDITDEIEEQKKANPLEGMKSVGRFREMLESERWTIPMLARAEIDDLTPYPGIGETIAGRIIKEAQTLWQPTQF